MVKTISVEVGNADFEHPASYLGFGFAGEGKSPNFRASRISAMIGMTLRKEGGSVAVKQGKKFLHKKSSKCQKNYWF